MSTTKPFLSGRTKEKLSQVIRVLSDVEERNFNIGVWRRHRDKVNHNECGTVACAVGHAASDPWFMERGLTMCVTVPSYEGFSDWEAVCSFFQIESDQAYHLFAGTSYHVFPEDSPVTREMVIGRIKRFIDNNGVF